MGVIKDLLSIANQDFSEDSQQDLCFSDTESIESIHIQLGNYKNKLKKIAHHRNGDKPENFLTDHYYRLGDRSSKRRKRIINNNKFLMQMGEDLDHSPCDEMITVNDFIENNYSAFTLIFSAVENYQAWEEFINSSEEDQEKILNLFESWEKGRRPRINNGDQLDSIIEEMVEDGGENIIADEIGFDARSKGAPAAMPTLDAKQQFLKIDNHIKDLLTKKQLPIEKLLNIETDLRTYFSQYPKSTYTAVLENSYHRLLTHGICKYLDLISKSDDRTTPKSTVVRNRRNVFRPPRMYLVEYLGERINKPQDVLIPTLTSLKIES